MSSWPSSSEDSSRGDSDAWSTYSDSNSNYKSSSTPSSTATSVAGVAKDELRNTKFPPEMSPDRVQAHMALLQKTTANARQFYEIDRTLEYQDRVNLYKAFQHQMFSEYFGAGLGLATGYQGPKWICKWLNKPWKQHYSSMGCLIMFVVGYTTVEKLSVVRTQMKYADNEKYMRILKPLQQFPPVLGYTYYRETKENPGSKFPDPSELNWAKYPMFPVALTAFRTWQEDETVKSGRAHAPSESGTKAKPESPYPTRFPRDSESIIIDDGNDNGSNGSWGDSTWSTQERSYPYSDSKSNNSPQQQQQPSMSSWDRIRAQNANGNSAWDRQRSPSSSGYNSNGQDGDLFQDPFEEDSK